MKFRSLNRLCIVGVAIALAAIPLVAGCSGEKKQVTFVVRDKLMAKGYCNIETTNGEMFDVRPSGNFNYNAQMFAKFQRGCQYTAIVYGPSALDESLPRITGVTAEGPCQSP